MKKLFKTVFIATLLFTLNANSQITKGNWMIGGDASFSYFKNYPKENLPIGTFSNSITEGSYDINIRPNIGYFVIDKLAIGSVVDYGLGKLEKSDFQISGSRLTIGFFTRYYFLKTDNRFNVYLETSFARSTYRLINSNASVYAIKVGNAIFLNSSVAIETSLNYSNTLTEYSTGKKLYFGLGLQIYLEKE